jgi:molybdopterin converting factor small subunit
VALINGRKASPDEKIKDEDEVAFLFAIAGG